MKQEIIISLPFVIPHPVNFNLIIKRMEKLLTKNRSAAKSPFTTISQRFEKFKSANAQLPISSNVPKRFRFRKGKVTLHLDFSEAGHGAVSFSFIPGANPRQSPIPTSQLKSIEELKYVRNFAKKLLKETIKELASKLNLNPVTDDIFITILYFGNLDEIGTARSSAKTLITKYTGGFRELVTSTGEIHLFSKKMLLILPEITSRNAQRNFSTSVYHASILAYCTHILGVNFDKIVQKNLSLKDWSNLLVSLNPYVISGRNRSSYNLLNGIGRHVFLKIAMQHHSFEKFRSALLDAVLRPDTMDYPDLLTIIFALYRIPMVKPALPPLMVNYPPSNSAGLAKDLIDHLRKRMTYYLEFATRHPQTRYLSKEEELEILGDYFPNEPEQVLKQLRSYRGGDIISNMCNALGLRRETMHQNIRDTLAQLMNAGIVIGKHMKRPGIHQNNLVYFININETELRKWIGTVIESLFPLDIATE